MYTPLRKKKMKTDMKFIDLHVHSNKSDGSFSPRELVSYALEKGLSAFALTDHDTIDGIAEVMEASEDTDVETIPGIELSTVNEGRDVHILGLFIDTGNQDFLSYLEHFQNSRRLRNEKMCRKLSEGLSIDLTFEKLQSAFPDAVITRSHYARYLKDTGVVKSAAEAFERYIGDHCPYFIPREKVTPEQGIDLIKKAGGIAVLAHPILYRMSSRKLDALTGRLKESGLDGIEAIYTTYSPSEESQIKDLAKKYDLLISGGSDFHGVNKVNTDLATGRGNLFVPYDYLTMMKDYLKERKTER